MPTQHRRCIALNKKPSLAMLALGLLLLPLLFALAAISADSRETGLCPAATPGGTRYSPLTQITPANVSQLKVAWVYHMKPAGGTRVFTHRKISRW